MYVLVAWLLLSAACVNRYILKRAVTFSSATGRFRLAKTRVGCSLPLYFRMLEPDPSNYGTPIEEPREATLCSLSSMPVSQHHAVHVAAARLVPETQSELLLDGTRPTAHLLVDAPLGALDARGRRVPSRRRDSRARRLHLRLRA